jgi:hypothetical protein
MKFSATVRPVAVAIPGIAIAGIIAMGAQAHPRRCPARRPRRQWRGSWGGSAGGHHLQMTELYWEPRAYSTSHSHPLAQVARVLEGALGMSLQAVAATLTRDGSGATLESVQPVEIGQEIVLGPRDCVFYDENTAHTVHTVWNASESTIRMWMADLVRIGAPYTTYVTAEGTPVP